MQAADFGDQLLRAQVLQHIAHCARFDGAQDVRLIPKNGAHHHSAIRPGLPRRGNHIQAGAIGQAQVHQKHVERLAWQQGQRFAPVSRHPHHA
ncbi:hypothetical protein D3C87_1489980 [compost metagenome]